MEKVKMNVLGITSSQIQAGAYALVLNEEDGAYRLPVIVGVAEAQSIAVKLEDVTPPRPLSHRRKQECPAWFPARLGPSSNAAGCGRSRPWRSSGNDRGRNDPWARPRARSTAPA